MAQDALGHAHSDEGSKLINEPREPLHGIFAQRESGFKDEVKQGEKDGVTQPSVCDDAVNALGARLAVLLGV